MADYKPGHIKRDPVTGASATRTIFPDSDNPGAAVQGWGIFTLNMGPRYAKTSEVESWDDEFTPPEG